MPKILTLKQLLNKKYKFLEGLPENIVASFGLMVQGFPMIVWGESGNGKSNFLMQFLAVLMHYGNVLYVGLEEGTRVTMQNLAARHFSAEVHSGKIRFTDHEMTYDELQKTLQKKKSPKIIVIDSIQYWDITYDDYKALKEGFKNKIFIYTSHANGKLPDGKVANKVRYDADIKVRVEGFVCFIVSRFGGTRPYVIYEAGARAYWGKDYRKKIQGIKVDDQKKPAKKTPQEIVEQAEKEEA